MKQIKWKRSRGRYVDSHCGRWQIMPASKVYLLREYHHNSWHVISCEMSIRDAKAYAEIHKHKTQHDA